MHVHRRAWGIQQMKWAGQVDNAIMTEFISFPFIF